MYLGKPMVLYYSRCDLKMIIYEYMIIENKDNIHIIQDGLIYYKYICSINSVCDKNWKNFVDILKN